MAGLPLEKRVEILERQVNGLATKQDVQVVADQILQFGVEMRVGSSALRAEIRGGDEETRNLLGEQIRAGDEETRRFMGVLHEDVVERIGRLQR